MIALNVFKYLDHIDYGTEMGLAYIVIVCQGSGNLNQFGGTLGTGS